MSYVSPIKIGYEAEPEEGWTDKIGRYIAGEVDNLVLQSCVKVGCHVDKDELEKALRYDRGQYNKGYEDGKRDAAAAIEALVKRVKCAEEKIKLYKGEADLYKDLYRSAHEAFTKELYGPHGTLANLQSLTQSPIPHNLCPNRAEEVYNLCANYPKKQDSSENPNS